VGTTFRDNVEDSRIEILVDGEVAGFEAYELGDGRIYLNHTEIAKSFAGRGLARDLVVHVLDDARSRALSVLPYCPYVAKFIREHASQYLDLVAPVDREQFDL
jgi:predicted GNAT family acetyltransferase